MTGILGIGILRKRIESMSKLVSKLIVLIFMPPLLISRISAFFKNLSGSDKALPHSLKVNELA